MSLNLTLVSESTGKEINLWQTPTYITFMCLSSDPETLLPDGGMLAVRRRYLLWLDSNLNGVWKSSEDLDAMREDISEHKDKVMSIEDPLFRFI